MKFLARISDFGKGLSFRAKTRISGYCPLTDSLCENLKTFKKFRGTLHRKILCEKPEIPGKFSSSGAIEFSFVEGGTDAGSARPCGKGIEFTDTPCVKGI